MLFVLSTKPKSVIARFHNVKHTAVTRFLKQLVNRMILKGFYLRSQSNWVSENFASYLCLDFCDQT